MFFTNICYGNRRVSILHTVVYLQLWQQIIIYKTNKLLFTQKVLGLRAVQTSTVCNNFSSHSFFSVCALHFILHKTMKPHVMKEIINKPMLKIILYIWILCYANKVYIILHLIWIIAPTSLSRLSASRGFWQLVFYNQNKRDRLWFHL